MSVTEQGYRAVLAVIADGRTVSEVASERGVKRILGEQPRAWSSVDFLDPYGEPSNGPEAKLMRRYQGVARLVPNNR